MHSLEMPRPMPADHTAGRREAMARTAARLRAQLPASRDGSRARLMGLRRCAGPLPAHRLRQDDPGNHPVDAPKCWRKSVGYQRRSRSRAGTLGARGPGGPSRIELQRQRHSHWDSTPREGQQGVWQFIAPTFAAYHERATTSTSIWSPRRAFINYARATTGWPPTPNLTGLIRLRRSRSPGGIEDAAEFVQPRPKNSGHLFCNRRLRAGAFHGSRCA